MSKAKLALSETVEQKIAKVRRDNSDFSSEHALAYLEAMESRAEQKDQFLLCGFSNRLAEKALDRQGWPRPYGWASVFFYPGSRQLRYRYVAFGVLAGLTVFWASANG